jgi:hypothetical protein
MFHNILIQLVALLPVILTAVVVIGFSIASYFLGRSPISLDIPKTVKRVTGDELVSQVMAKVYEGKGYHQAIQELKQEGIEV